MAERAAALARESEAAIAAREVALATDAQRMLTEKQAALEVEFAGALAARQAEFAEVETSLTARQVALNDGGRTGRGRTLQIAG